MADQASGSSNQGGEPRYDNIARVRTLVWSLKEAVQVSVCFIIIFF